LILRAAIVVGLLITTVVAERTVTRSEASVPRERLQTLPLTLEGWQGRAATPLPKDVVALLGVDEHVYRSYVQSGIPVNLYAGYYESQKRGDAIHSPQNCLPGSGWYFLDSRTRDIRIGRSSVSVNQHVIQKGAQTQVVLYWYQGRGRVVANEYANKALLVWDAATKRRTSGGLVRIMTPVLTTADAAAADATAFAAVLLPWLERVMP
jgi:EpsI family protein